jgi:hypothetical protein
MSTPSDSGLDLEALELQLLPAWARQSTAPNPYADFQGDRPDSGGRRRDHRGPPGRGSDRGPGRRPGGESARRSDDRGRPPRREGGPRQGGPRRDDRVAPPAAPVLPEVNVNLIPEPKGVESLARQIRLTGRAYPIFEIAQLILRKPDRYQVRFNVVRKPDGQVAQALWLCNLDDTVWLSEQDAVQQVLRQHFDTFYQVEKTPTDPPKGTYTFVAQCGLSGTILGPPNFHDYQAKLARLHSARYSRMPFEAFKARVRIVRDEAVVKQWIEDQSFKTSYVCLNVPEALTLDSMAEVETHFRQVHLPNIIRTVDEWTVDGAAAQRIPATGLRQLARRAWDDQHRFPLKLVGVLSQQFASHGLQFFKVNKTVTHVSVARPHYLDVEATPVSDGIRRIVDHIDNHPGCTRRLLLNAIAPAPPAAPAPSPAETKEAPAPVDSTAVDDSSTTTAPETAVKESSASDAPPAPEAAKAPASVPTQPELTPEQTAVTADLHWLIHQGHVIEFATGKLETAKKPKPKPAPLPRPVAEPKPGVSPAATVQTPSEAETSPVPPAPADAEGDSNAQPSTPPAHPESPTPPAEPDSPTPPSQPESPAPPAEPESPTPPAEPESPAPPAKPEVPGLPAEPGHPLPGMRAGESNEATERSQGKSTDVAAAEEKSEPGERSESNEPNSPQQT